VQNWSGIPLLKVTVTRRSSTPINSAHFAGEEDAQEESQTANKEQLIK
jgi:hypothetical protein